MQPLERGFRFAVGIEDTFVPHGFPGHRALDEYELTQHYRFWSEDLGLAAPPTPAPPRSATGSPGTA